MSAITAVAKALFNTFFQSWSNPSSPSISLLLYSHCCVIFLLVFYHRFDGYFHVLLKIIASSCVNHIRTLKKKLIDFDVTSLFSGICSAIAFKSIRLGSNAKDKKVCTVELDPGEVPSLYESEEEEEERRRQQQRQKQLGKEDRIKEECSSRQRSNIQCKDTFEILIQKLSECEEDIGSFDETLAFWRRKEMEEIISRRKLKY
ncbi:uncharacterized protein LOC120134122 [Hibiscus syriacus]|uniref:uncharacterized protein LOC120134122 n=1 Tax=Hibiscus syriacus TaxID=106335 RepID=UPI0019204801|nr:uncharacterized protein LOC120134122 [Hibiscus syriacus]